MIVKPVLISLCKVRGCKCHYPTQLVKSSENMDNPNVRRSKFHYPRLQCQQKISERGMQFKSRATSFSETSGCRIPLSSDQVYPPWPVVLTLTQVSHSCLGRHRTFHSSEMSPWTSHPGTSQWPGTSHLCGAPAHHSSEACRRIGLGSCGGRSHKKKAHRWWHCLSQFDSTPTEQKVSRDTAQKWWLKRNTITVYQPGNSRDKINWMLRQ